MAHLHVVGGNNVHIHHLTTQAPTGSPNTDSLGINRCNGVVIEDCKLETGAALQQGTCLGAIYIVYTYVWCLK